MSNKLTYIFSAIVIILTIGIILLFVQNTRQKGDIAAMEEMMTFEKEQLESEYEDLAMQYDGYNINISNDSLVQELAQEKQRVQDLLEELRITKATDARKIAALKKELTTLRAVMRDYVAQIDSLNRENQQIRQENKEVRQQYQVAQAENETLTQEKSRLTEVVSRAAMMEVTGFKMTPLNKRDRATSRFNAIQKLQFDFTIAKNITTAPGEKTVYMQLRRPDGDLMLKSDNHTFAFEGSRQPYSLKSDFEYAGEAISRTLYWPVEEILQEGMYTAEFFIDGNMVGSFVFTLK